MTLRQLSPQFRTLVTVYVVVSCLGMGTGLVFLSFQDQLKPSGIETHYKGNENNLDAAEIKFEKTMHDMLLTTHNHLLGLASVFFITGILMMMSSLFSGGWRTFLAVEPLVSLILTFGGIWLVRFIAGMEWFSIVIMLSGIAMFSTFFLNSLSILFDLWMRHE